MSMRWSPEDITRITQQDRDEITEALQTAGEYRFWLESLESGQWEEEDTENLCDRLNGLLRSFGADPAEWKKTYIGSDLGDSRRGLSYKEFQQVQHARIGEFVAGAAQLALDVESEEDGSATSSWFFWLGNEHIIQIKSEGAHWTDRTYRHPGTGEFICPDDSELAELESKYNRELEHVGAEYGMENEFNAVIRKAPEFEL